MLFVLLTLSLSSWSSPLDLTQEQELDRSGLVKVLNYNTVEQGQFPEWKEIIRQENPDIILQVETGFIENLEPWKDELNAFFPDEQPYEVAGFDGKSGTDGQAVYSRYPILSSNVIDTVILDDGNEHKMNHPFIEAKIDINGLEVYFFANHLSCCTSFAARMLEQEGFINYMDSLGDVPILYGGDFNSDSPQDVGDVAPLQGSLLDEPIEMMINMSHPTGPEIHQFYDTYRELNPDRKGYTLNHEGRYDSIDHFRGRIDYIFVNHHLVDTMVNSSVVTNHPAVVSASDHKPMYTWFNFNSEVDLHPPTNPVNVGLASVTSTGVTLSWDANTEDDLFKYSVYRNGSLLGETASEVTTFVDTHQFNPDVTYVYDGSATDILGNEGIVSLPVFAQGSVGEFYAPYGISLQALPNGNLIGLNWTISGETHLPITQIKVYKELKSDGTYIIDSFTTGNSTVVDVSKNIRLYMKISVVNAIGESELTNYTFIGDNHIQVNEVQPDRTNVYEYGEHLENMVADHSAPYNTIDIPAPETTNSTTSDTASETSSTSQETSGTTSDTSESATSASTPVSNFWILNLIFALPLLRKKKNVS
jgi:exonuclease III